MFHMITTLFNLFTNFILGTDKFVSAYAEAGKWCEDSMKGFNSIADKERQIRLAKLQADLNAQLAQLPQQPQQPE